MVKRIVRNRMGKLRRPNKRVNLTVSPVTALANSGKRRATRPAGYAQP